MTAPAPRCPECNRKACPGGELCKSYVEGINDGLKPIWPAWGTNSIGGLLTKARLFDTLEAGGRSVGDAHELLDKASVREGALEARVASVIAQRDGYRKRLADRATADRKAKRPGGHSAAWQALDAFLKYNNPLRKHLETVGDELKRLDEYDAAELARESSRSAVGGPLAGTHPSSSGEPPGEQVEHVWAQDPEANAHRSDSPAGERDPNPDMRPTVIGQGRSTPRPVDQGVAWSTGHTPTRIDRVVNGLVHVGDEVFASPAARRLAGSITLGTFPGVVRGLVISDATIAQLRVDEQWTAREDGEVSDALKLSPEAFNAELAKLAPAPPPKAPPTAPRPVRGEAEMAERLARVSEHVDVHGMTLAIIGMNGTNYAGGSRGQVNEEAVRFLLPLVERAELLASASGDGPTVPAHLMVLQGMVSLPEALARLYNAVTCPAPWPGPPATEEDAKAWVVKAIEDDDGLIDYLNGRVMKIYLHRLLVGDPMVFRAYDRDNGEGRGAEAVAGQDRSASLDHHMKKPADDRDDSPV